MNISEKLDSVSILHDSKARRILNTAPSAAPGITAEELNDGVTIEKLESLTVPVYQYATQITIHGLFTEAPAIVAGYKSLTLNNNGSLGVKYGAIDAQKKSLLWDISRQAERGTWSINITSQGCEAVKYFRDMNGVSALQAAKECYAGTPDSLYVGSKFIARLMFNMGFAVVLEIGAIYQRDLWPLIESLTGLTERAYNARIAQQEKEYNARRAESIKAEEAARAKFEYAMNERITALKESGIPRAKYTGPGFYLRAGTIAGVPCCMITWVKKMPFGKVGIFNRGIIDLTQAGEFTPRPGKKAMIIDPAEFSKKELYAMPRSK